MYLPLSTIRVVVQCLINLTKQEISLIRGLDGEAEKLRDTLVIIQSYLDDAQTKSITDAGVKTWLKKLQQKAYDADNTLDELNYQLLSNKRKKKTKASYFQRRQLSLRINEINTSFVSMNARAKELGLEEKLAVAAPGEVSLETNSFTVDPIFIGRNDDVLKIVEMLTNPTEEAMSILPIVGMGGLGKTTMARNVVNHQKIKAHFGKRIWVHVSQNFDVGVLFKKILTNLKSEKVEDGSSIEAVLKKLQEGLKDTTYLLVLDDMWNEDQQKWGDFIRSWSGITSTKGNGMVVTTRNVGVGSLVKTLDMHHLNGLSDEQCWSIIKGSAIEGGSIITHDLVDIGKSIAERCRGLPLAANMVGGVLRGKSPDEWRSIKDKWLSGDGEDYISKILKLSFHHLPTPSLKNCFAYCSIFPKGDWIDKVGLIELWMAEGFVQPDQTSDMETVGNKIFNNLLHNSLLQVVNRDEHGEVESCSMHDLVHDVASSILDSTYFKNIDASSHVPKEQAKWYVYWGSNGYESRIPKDEAKWLRTLIYNGGISGIIFSDFKSLHSLTLRDGDVEELPDSIRELIHLRYLNISCTRIRYLPNSIGELFHLQTISSFILNELPSILKNLFNLRHLHIGNETALPPYLGMLTSLQTLPCFKVRDEEGHRIVELESLKNLKGKFEICNLEKVQGEEESKKACLFQKPGIVRLVLKWGEIGAREGEINDENVLKGLQPHSNLKGLKIIGFAGSCFPSWTLNMAVHLEGRWEALNNLLEIILKDCSECEEIPMLGQLPHLKSLMLDSLKKVKSLGASFYGIEECNGVYKETISVFPALKRLELEQMTNLTEWKGVEIPSGAHMEVFPCLEYLKIYRCEKLRSAPSQFTSLKELFIYKMDSGLPLASICGSKLKTLTKLIIVDIKVDIRSIEELICLPDWRSDSNSCFSELPALILNIFCPKLRELPNGLHSLNSLKKLTLSVKFCEGPDLKSIPFPVSGSEKLQGLTSVRELSIKGCRVLKNFVSEMEDSCVAPLLEDLHVHAGYSDEWDCVSSFNKVVDRILRFRSHSLVSLQLTGREDWESLPDQLQHLTSLPKLTLTNFGIEELPEWFGNLSSLKELSLLNCTKLKHLPSMEAMRRLTKLTKLVITDCPLLKERGIETESDDADSEWPKISHLPNIWVDYKYIRYNGETRT